MPHDRLAIGDVISISIIAALMMARSTNITDKLWTFIIRRQKGTAADLGGYRLALQSKLKVTEASHLHLDVG